MKKIMLGLVFILLFNTTMISASSSSSVYQYERPNFAGGFIMNGGLTSTLFWQHDGVDTSEASLSYSCWRLMGDCYKTDEKIKYYDDRIVASQNINLYVGVKSKWVDLSLMSETYAIYHEGYANGQSYVYQR